MIRLSFEYLKIWASPSNFPCPWYFQFQQTMDLKLPRSNLTTVNTTAGPTDIQCTSYSDRHFVVVSQLKNFGTWIHAWCEECPDGRVLYQTKVLLGKRDDPILHIYARQIVEKIAGTSADRKPLLLAISLHRDAQDAKTMQEVLNALFEINTWQWLLLVVGQVLEWVTLQ